MTTTTLEGPSEAIPTATERDPLLGSSSSAQRPELKKKPWYRPRPLWLVPFAITASLCRGMTLAPRTEVFIQLACEDLWLSRQPHHTSRHHHTLSLSPLHADFTVPSYSAVDGDDVDRSALFLLNRSSIIPLSIPETPFSYDGAGQDGNLPWEAGAFANTSRPANCSANPDVQVGAAKMQTIMVTTMGSLSVLTTGWWGQFGDRHGRTKVIAFSVIGLLFTDVMFILASNPPRLLQGRGNQLLVVAPIIEGLLGGWSSLTCATQAYISDCTSSGSRANVYSRFTGVLYIGIAFGPEIAAIMLRTKYTMTAVFFVSAIGAAVNVFLLLFVFPESLSAEVRTRNVAAFQEARVKASQQAEGKMKLWRSATGTVKAFVEPLSILGPKPRQHGRGQDWSLTLLTMAMFCYFLTMGLYQIKYLYIKHVYSWETASLSHYITAVGLVRSVLLLLVLPALIRVLKPAPSKAHPARSTTKAKKVPPTPRVILSDIKFDLMVAKISAIIDILSHVLVTLAASSSQELFIGFSAISSLGCGMVPALQSVAMSTLYLRELSGEEETVPDKGGKQVGRLFGALAVLQAAGSMILGPLVFGTVYGMTVGVYPKTIFVTAACLLVVSIVMLLLIRPVRVDVPIEIRVDTQVQVDVETVRGRSRESKDIGAGLHRGYMSRD